MKKGRRKNWKRKVDCDGAGELLQPINSRLPALREVMGFRCSPSVYTLYSMMSYATMHCMNENPFTIIIGKVYDDVAHPSTKIIGEILAKCTEFIIGIETNKRRYDLLKKNMLECLRKIKKKIDTGKKFNEAPRLNIAIPIMNQISLIEEKELDEMFTELLAKECTKEESPRVLPAFVEILKNLSSDEAKMLKKINSGFSFIHPETNHPNTARPYTPIVKIRANNADKTYEVIQDVYTDSFDSLQLDYKENIPIYLSNLKRIGLITIPTGTFEGGIIHNFPYQSYFKNKLYIQKVERDIQKNNRTLDLEEGHIAFTDLGKKFMIAVLE